MSSTIADNTAQPADDFFPEHFDHWLRFIGHAEGDPFELQALDVPDGKWANNYFAHARTLAQAIDLLREADTQDPPGPGIYTVLNRIQPAITARAQEGEWHTMKKGAGTTDRDIAARTALYVDLDADRPRDISATEGEVSRVFDVADKVKDKLAAIVGADAIGQGFSGNGCALFVALDHLPESPELLALVTDTLGAIKALFEVPGVKIDTSVSDAKRLCPAWGTTKRKGMNTLERQHRRTAFLCSDRVSRVGLEGLRKLRDSLRAELPPEAKKPATVTPLRPDSPFTRANAVDPKAVAEWLGLYNDKDELTCPGCGATKGVDIFGHGLKCLHASCVGKGRNGFRTVVDLVAEVRKVEPYDAMELVLEHFAPSRATSGPTCLPFKRADQAELADELLASLGPKGWIIHDEGDFWRYDPARGIWSAIDPAELLCTLKGYAGAEIVGARPLKMSISTAEGAIKFAAAAVRRTSFFAKARKGVGFSDCLISIDTKGEPMRLAHNPDNRIRHGFEFPYVADHLHPELDRFLADIFMGAPDKDDRIALLQEFAGACLVGIAPAFERCLVLYGSGGNGKSQVLRLFRALFPATAVACVPPQKWARRFVTSRLVGVLANFVDEMPDVDIEGSEQFKAIITGGAIETERKNRDGFNFTATAGHIFSCNNLPGTVDQSHGYWRRFAICLFDRDLEAAPCHRPNAAEWVIEKELAALAAWAIKGAVRLQKQKGYTIPETSKTAKEEWRESSDSVAMFLKEKTTSAPDDSKATPAAQLYARYKHWAFTNGHKAVAIAKFASRMKGLGKPSKHTNAGAKYPVQLAGNPSGDG